jgi:hypothetical protein
MLRPINGFDPAWTNARRVLSALAHPQVLARLTALAQPDREPCPTLGPPCRHRMLTLVGHTPVAEVVVRRLLFTVPCM